MNLPDIIRERFLPFAFQCDCQGTHSTCAKIKNEDVYAIAQAETVERIAKYLESLTHAERNRVGGA